MSSIVPSLPPHLTKRTRDDDDERSTSPESSEKRRRVQGPAPPPRVVGPALPPSRSRSSSADSDLGPMPPKATPATPKSVRVLGPSAPPAALSERPPNPPSDTSDSDSGDDDFGPAPPPSGAQYSAYDDDQPTKIGPSAFDTDEQYAEQAKKAQRDEWMTLPPTQDDLAARMDPTKLRARKFNSGKGAHAPGDGMGVWTETPEQKLKRLQNEALGITAPANSSNTTKESRRTKEEEARLRKIREKVESARGSSLMDQHKDKGVGKEKEDDPSKRGFDYEKDMGIGMKVGHKQRIELLNKAKGFGDRFSSGSFL
ncbi:hypothetical protein K505DRAFT_323786 [Melanomma pulvis-pyrius CBS 109.77]|uniref:DUF3752 domain-containing protein n=1 Tax=Melanomma pulvis-pyrius CBS 109.77 TaxID=1314802 RepID=A0A6A6XIS1_9PLEO|nr:hypothetical protein K505DRAFT_323786 [Melanomma pulvis-pyrius CBS 109.77]